MANWIGSSRSNYFKVKDLAAFQAMVAAELPKVDVSAADEVEGPRQGKVCLLISRNSDSGDWPTSRWDEDKDEEIEIDMIALIAPHLEEGEVVVLQTIGAEKLRYLTGDSVAFDHTGESVSVGINSIYEMAKQRFGKQPDLAQY